MSAAVVVAGEAVVDDPGGSRCDFGVDIVCGSVLCDCLMVWCNTGVGGGVGGGLCMGLACLK